eukprot:TRINITY_DN5955_c0_g1_i3.p1 TRINITY_DN5955_c0_g1~~TRINITY_DN5955_c0_g1_i3.p1  ORF type:complete len:353 (+),score=93.37 TRINITY_DN5955_c0_g1_i3:81-1139(+)
MCIRDSYCVYFLIGLGILATVGLIFVAVTSLNPSATLEEMIRERKVSLAFADFKAEHGRVYATPEEEQTRRSIFKANYERILATNRAQSSFELEVNQFADLTEEEFRERYLTKPEYVDSSEFENTSPEEYTDDLNKDWERDGYMNDIRDQGNCGSCWTFASVAAAEAMYAIQHNQQRLEFSEQQLVDCFTTPLSNGCQGGERYEALHYIYETGAVSRKEYPYKALKGECNIQGLHLEKPIGDYKNLTKGDNNLLAQQVLSNPVTIGLNASPFHFRFYKKGIVTHGCPHDEINHAVVAVGVGNENGVAFWRIRNSWGKNWGDKGHIRIKRVSGNSPGLCGVAVKACTPTKRNS